MASAFPTTSDIKSALGISGSTEDTQIGYIANAVKTFVEKETGRTFAASGNTSRYFTIKPHVSKDRRTLTFFADLVSVNSVTNGDGTTVSASDYWLAPQQSPYYQIVLDPTTGLVWTTANQRIEISGVWGYAGTVPDDLFYLCIDLAQYLYNARISGSGGANLIVSDRTGMIVAPDKLQDRVYQVLRNYRR